MLLAVSSCSIFVTAYLGYRSGQSNLTDRVFSQLTSLRASKAHQIEFYFETIRNHTQTLSRDLMIVAAMQEFNLNIRIGIDSGDVVAGIVGRSKFIYDAWGNPINVAGELKAACPPGSILVSQDVHTRLHDLYDFEPMGDIEADGNVVLTAWRLKSTRQPVQAES